MYEDAPPIALAYKEPGSVSTLKKSYRGKLVLPDSETFLKELMGESDRAAVILAASMLDDLLANTIAMKMDPKMRVAEVDKVFRSSGPLGSFAARIEIASLFKIIDDTTFVQLSTLREMRNACAHSKHPIQFSDALLMNVAMHFFKGSSMEAAAKVIPLKLAFCAEVTFLTMVLTQGSRHTAMHLRIKALSESKAAAPAYLEVLVKYLEGLTPPEK